jgi:membrane protein implicated in regulation of membrane protease activity
MIGLLAGILAPAIGAKFARAGAWALIAVGAALILGGAWLWLDSREKADDKANQEIGAAVQREGDLRETIERTETANEAREEIGRHDAAGDRLRYDQCLRSARTPANCERFLPR